MIRVWIEAKWGAREQPEQLEHYREELGDRGLLVALVPARRSREVGDRAVTLTWETVGVLADRVGREDDDDPQWRGAAMHENAPARQRVLALFLDYLRRERGMSIEPLRTDHALALRLAADAIAISDRLAEEAIRRAGLQEKSSGVGADPHDKWWTFQTPKDWSHRGAWHPDAWPELQRSSSGAHDREAVGEPVFHAGLSLPSGAAARLLEAEALAAWRDDAHKHGFSVSGGGRGEYTRLFATLPLAALASASATFDGQAEHLSQWVTRKLGYAADLDPGVDWSDPVESSTATDGATTEPQRNSGESPDASAGVGT